MPEQPRSESYKEQLLQLQIELVKHQGSLVASDRRVAVVFEGRDAAGKDGTIKRIVEHLSPRRTREVALGVPSDRDKTSWYFARYAPHLPAAQEVVLFNRSWYNRAGVERVMGFCTDREYDDFMDTVNGFERALVRTGMQLFKYYLDISRKEQKRRLEERKDNPLKQWKTSPIDKVAHEKWGEYSEARNEMFARTHTSDAPWRIVHADDKKAARLNIIRDLLAHLDYEDKDESLLEVDPDIVFPYTQKAVDRGRIMK